MASGQPQTPETPAGADADQTSAAPPQRREVAVSFLFKYASGSDARVQVALFRRSGEVRTYQHKLAPISGSVERRDSNAPLATALREIREETALDPPSDLQLLRQGKPYAFADESVGREWIVHPFAFRLKSNEEGGKGEEGIATDWEHEGWEWHDPLLVEDSDEFGGVPRLRDSLRRVWPEIDLGAEAGGALAAGLHDLRTDHESGARQLAAKAVSILHEVVAKSGLSAMDGDAGWAKIRMAAWHLWTNGRESMGAAILGAMVSALDRIEPVVLGTDDRPEEKMRWTLSYMDKLLAERRSAVPEIQASFADLVEGRVRFDGPPQNRLSILTLSCSSTISSCLSRAAAALDGVAIDLRILESRPLCEGVALASRLLSEAGPGQEGRMKITLYTDAAAALAAEGVDLVLLGADRISAAGDVSNKTGSLPAVLSARHVAPGARVVVVSGVDKVAGPGAAGAHAVEENDAAELTRGWRDVGVQGAEDVVGAASSSGRGGHGAAKVEVKNVYFEWVPACLVDAYVTDEGVWSAAEIRKKSDRVGAEIARFFGDL